MQPLAHREEASVSDKPDADETAAAAEPEIVEAEPEIVEAEPEIIGAEPDIIEVEADDLVPATVDVD